ARRPAAPLLPAHPGRAAGAGRRGRPTRRHRPRGAGQARPGRCGGSRMSGDLDLEQRYRRVLRLLPGYYRDMWEEGMVAAFLDSWLTGDPDEDSVTMEYDRLHHALRAVPRLPRGPQRALPQAWPAGHGHLRG